MDNNRYNNKNDYHQNSHVVSRKVAYSKQERMSPADYVEAEEYDDDELLKDDWDR